MYSATASDRAAWDNFPSAIFFLTSTRRISACCITEKVLRWLDEHDLKLSSNDSWSSGLMYGWRLRTINNGRSHKVITIGILLQKCVWDMQCSNNMCQRVRQQVGFTHNWKSMNSRRQSENTVGVWLRGCIRQLVHDIALWLRLWMIFPRCVEWVSRRKRPGYWGEAQEALDEVGCWIGVGSRFGLTP